MNQPPPGRLHLLMWGGAFIPAVVALFVALARAPSEDWWVEYHAGLEAKPGPAYQGYRRSGRFVFNKWRKPPVELPGRFVVRYATCLVLEAPQSVVLQLVSSDRASLLVDGKKTLEARAAGKKRLYQVGVAGRAVTLRPGVHHLLVEARERRRSRFGVLASLAGEQPTDLPSSMLRRPDAQGHCE